MSEDETKTADAPVSQPLKADEGSIADEKKLECGCIARKTSLKDSEGEPLYFVRRRRTGCMHGKWLYKTGAEALSMHQWSKEVKNMKSVKDVREELENITQKKTEQNNQQSEIEIYAPAKDQHFEIMDREDELQIVEELKGKVIDKYFYEFEDTDKRKVVGISYAGTKYIALRKGNIETVEIHAEDCGSEYVCYVIVKDTKRNISMPGGASQPKKIKLRSGEEIPDKFAYAKVISKATRNAIRALIPEELIKQLYKIWKEKGGTGEATVQQPTTEG